MRKLGKLLLLLLALVLAADAVWQVAHPVFLQGFFTNDDYNLLPTPSRRSIPAWSESASTSRTASTSSSVHRTSW